MSGPCPFLFIALELLWEHHVESGDTTFESLPLYGDFSVMKAWPAASASAGDGNVAEA